jgi:hypothetical protein
VALAAGEVPLRHEFDLAGGAELAQPAE